MKKSFFLFCLVIFISQSPALFSQKYKTAADTLKLNKEYTSVSNSIADLTSELTKAQNNLPDYKAKAVSAGAEAQNSASASSDQASLATNGDMGDAKSAKRKAKKAYKQAKNASSANDKVQDQNEKITRLTAQLNKKQQRLQELNDMRNAINQSLVVPTAAAVPNQ